MRRRLRFTEEARKDRQGNGHRYLKNGLVNAAHGAAAEVGNFLGGDQKVIIRGIGPSSTVPGKLANPILELRDNNGGLIASNDNWRSDQEAEIIGTTIPPSDDLESAIMRTLSPANYTAILRGVDNTTGVGVVEVYALN